MDRPAIGLIHWIVGECKDSGGGFPIFVFGGREQAPYRIILDRAELETGRNTS